MYANQNIFVAIKRVCIISGKFLQKCLVFALCVHLCKFRGCAVMVPDISVFGHFGPWARLLCRILASSCSRISATSRVRVRFGVQIRVRD